MQTASNALKLAEQVGAVALSVVSVYAVYKVVRYFVASDKSDIVDSENEKKYNTGKNILIGHGASTASALRAVVEKKDTMIDDKTKIRVTERFAAIAKEFGKDAEVHIYLRTPGGVLFYAVLIAQIVSTWQGKCIAHVMEYSCSGGTLIAMACSEIHMGPNSALGMIDPQTSRARDYVSTTLYLQSFGMDPLAVAAGAPVKQFLIESDEKPDERDPKEKKEALKNDTGVIDSDGNNGSNDDDGDGAKKCEKESKIDAKNALLFQKIDANIELLDAAAVLRFYTSFAREILSKNYKDAAVVERIVKFVMVDRSHALPIFRRDCKENGLNIVETDE